VLCSEVLPGSDLRLPGSEVLRGPALLCAGPVLCSALLRSGSLLCSEVLRGSALLCASPVLCSEVLPGSDLRLPGSEVLRGPALLCAGPVLCSALLRSGSLLCSEVLRGSALLCASPVLCSEVLSRPDLRLPGPELLQRGMCQRELRSHRPFGWSVRRSREGRLL